MERFFGKGKSSRGFGTYRSVAVAILFLAGYAKTNLNSRIKVSTKMIT
jgi:hypothetical protein